MGDINESSLMRFIPCNYCRDKKGPKEQKGYYYSKIGTVVECNCHKQWAMENRVLVSLEKLNISSNFINKNLSEITHWEASKKDVERFVKYVDNFSRFKSQCIYIYGPSDEVLEHVFGYFCTKLLTEGYSVEYELYTSLCRRITRFPKDFQKDSQKDISGDTSKIEYDPFFYARALDSDVLIIRMKKDTMITKIQQNNFDTFCRERILIKKKMILFMYTNPGPSSKGLVFNEIFPSGILDIITTKIESNGAIFEFKDAIGQHYDFKDILDGI